MLQAMLEQTDPPAPPQFDSNNIVTDQGSVPDGDLFIRFVHETDLKLNQDSVLVMDNASYHFEDNPNDPDSYSKYSNIRRPIYFAPNFTPQLSPIDSPEHGLKHLVKNASHPTGTIWDALCSIKNSVYQITKGELDLAWLEVRLGG